MMEQSNGAERLQCDCLDCNDYNCPDRTLEPKQCYRKTSRGNRIYPGNIIIVQLYDRDELYNELVAVQSGKKKLSMVRKIGNMTLGIGFDDVKEEDQ